MLDRDWYYDDRRQVGLDFAAAAEVESYDERQGGDPAEDRALAQKLGVGPGMTVADLGCGTGLLACELARLAGWVQAVDISPAMLRAARRRATAAGRANLEFHQASFLTFAAPAGSLDLVTSKFAFHHLPDLWKGVALVRLNRLLQPGGRLFLRDVAFSCLPQEVPEAVEAWIAWMTANTGYARAEVATHVREEHSTFAWVVEGLLERAGFRLLETDYRRSVYADWLAEKVQAL